jgi:hypothetical protein
MILDFITKISPIITAVAVIIPFIMFLILLREVRVLNSKSSQIIALLGGQPATDGTKNVKNEVCTWCSALVPVHAIIKSEDDKLCHSCWRAKCKEDFIG